jgi:hypothetical protein
MARDHDAFGNVNSDTMTGRACARETAGSLAPAVESAPVADSRKKTAQLRGCGTMRM